ncbi:MAG: hypothetical protein ACKOD9_06165, partial [Rubrivivax sp.]
VKDLVAQRLAHGGNRTAAFTSLRCGAIRHDIDPVLIDQSAVTPRVALLRTALAQAGAALAARVKVVVASVTQLPVEYVEHPTPC